MARRASHYPYISLTMREAERYALSNDFERLWAVSAEDTLQILVGDGEMRVMADCGRSVLIVRLAGLLALLLLSASGCGSNYESISAIDRWVLDVRIPMPLDPKSAQVVNIVRVRDLRKFDLAPRVPSVPSLKDGKIDDLAITSRAIARKRNAYGGALGDILLPEGRSVHDLVREAAQRALREKGYSVVSTQTNPGQPVIPFEVDICQFWGWGTPGWSAVTTEFEAVLTIRSPVLADGEEDTARGYTLLRSTEGGTRQTWMETMNKGLDDLVANLKQKIRMPQAN